MESEGYGSDIDNDVPESGAVFTFGRSKNQHESVPEKYYFRNDVIKQVCCGDRHSAFLTQSGKVFTFGNNEWGQLGHYNNSSVPEPKKVKALRVAPVALIACGRNHTVAYTQTNKMYSCGANTEGQLGIGKPSSDPTDYKFRLVPKLSKQGLKVIQLACGADFTMALTQEGHVYSWGDNDRGQLGLGDCESRNEPTRVTLIRESVKYIACGYYHSAVVTTSGRLWTFGDGESGQLGLSSQARISKKDSPECVLKIDEKVASVSCGYTHTGVITESGKLYTFGTGTSGQLGLGPRCMRTNLPQQVTAVRRSKCVQVACGENHTAVLNEKGQLIMFGDGKYGKLCQVGDEFANIFNPVPVPRFKNFKVLGCALGGDHTVVLASRKSTSSGFQDSEEEGGVESEEDEMSRFDYLGGTSHLRMMSLNKVSTLPSPHSPKYSANSPRDRRRIKKEKEKLSQTMPVSWSAKLGSLPDLTIDLPKLSGKSGQSHDLKKDSVKHIDDIKPADAIDEDLITPEQQRRIALHASAPDLTILKSETEQLPNSEKTKASKNGQSEDNLTSEDDEVTRPTESLDTTADSLPEVDDKDESGKKKGAFLSKFRKKSRDEEGESGKKEDKKHKKSEDAAHKEKDKKKKSKDDNEASEKSSKHISWADEEDSWAEDEDLNKGKKKKKKDKEKGKKEDKGKENDEPKKKSKKDKEEDDEENEKEKDKKEGGKKKGGLGFGLFGSKKSKEDVREEDEVEEFKAEDSEEDSQEEDGDAEEEQGEDKKKKKKSKKSKEKGKDKEKEKDKDKDKEKEKEKKKGVLGFFGSKEKKADDDVEEIHSDDDGDEEDGEDVSEVTSVDKQKKEKKKKDKEKEKESKKGKKDDEDKDGEEEDEKGDDEADGGSGKKNQKKEKEKGAKKENKDKDKKKNKKKDKKKSGGSNASLASAVSDDVEEIVTESEESEEGGDEEEDGEEGKHKKEKSKKEKEREKSKDKDKDKDKKKDKEKENEDSPDDKTKKTKKKVTIKDDKDSPDDENEPNKKKGFFTRFSK